MSSLIRKVAVSVASGALFLSVFAAPAFATSSVSITSNGKTTIISGDSNSSVSVTNSGGTNIFSSGRCGGRSMTLSIVNGAASWK